MVLQPARGPTHTAFLSPDGHALDTHSWGWSNALQAPPGPGTPTAALLPKSSSASPRPQPGIRGLASVKRLDAGPPAALPAPGDQQCVHGASPIAQGTAIHRQTPMGPN